MNARHDADNNITWIFKTKAVPVLLSQIFFGNEIPPEGTHSTRSGYQIRMNVYDL